MLDFKAGCVQQRKKNQFEHFFVCENWHWISRALCVKWFKGKKKLKCCNKVFYFIQFVCKTMESKTWPEINWFWGKIINSNENLTENDQGDSIRMKSLWVRIFQWIATKKPHETIRYEFVEEKPLPSRQIHDEVQTASSRQLSWKCQGVRK